MRLLLGRLGLKIRPDGPSQWEMNVYKTRKMLSLLAPPSSPTKPSSSVKFEMQNNSNSSTGQPGTPLGLSTTQNSVGIHTSVGSTNNPTLVVGLGNPTLPGTRHSVGMTIADRLCTHFELTWKKDRDCHGMVAMTTLEGGDHTLILLKPRHFMNMNGRSVIKTVNKFHIPVSNVFLLHDDLDRPLGKYSIKEGGSAGGHNGVRSVINSLGTNKMLRLRFGIDRPTNHSAVPDYVLEKFSSTEKDILPQLLDDCIHVVLKRIKQDSVK